MKKYILCMAFDLACFQFIVERIGFWKLWHLPSLDSLIGRILCEKHFTANVFLTHLFQLITKRYGWAKRSILNEKRSSTIYQCGRHICLCYRWRDKANVTNTYVHVYAALGALKRVHTHTHAHAAMEISVCLKWNHRIK